MSTATRAALAAFLKHAPLDEVLAASALARRRWGDVEQDYPFLAAIFAAPDDVGPRLVYADWLDDQDEEVLAQAVRAGVRVRDVDGRPRHPAEAFWRSLWLTRRCVWWQTFDHHRRLAVGERLDRKLERAGLLERSGLVAPTADVVLLLDSIGGEATLAAIAAAFGWRWNTAWRHVSLLRGCVVFSRNLLGDEVAAGVTSYAAIPTHWSKRGRVRLTIAGKKFVTSFLQPARSAAPA